jgi:hypothetical protein
LFNRHLLAHLKIALRYIFRSRAGVFRNIYLHNHWGNAESISGPGSGLEQARTIIQKFPELLNELQVETLLDAPCGDLNWMSKCQLPVKKYIGADIVDELIQENKKRFAQDRFREFLTLDICKDSLPKADLIIIRDTFVHLNYRSIHASIHNLKSSEIKWLLCTHFPGRKNSDIITGNWRPLNMEAEPFHFPAPEKLMNERCTEAEGSFSDKSLGLWKIQDLPI